MTANTIDSLCEAFSRQGEVCDTIVSDNGTQLVASNFERFCELNGIEHVTSAPYYPQSNGYAERFVGLLKEGLWKLEDTGNPNKVLRKFLMCYYYTPSRAL